jgi:hypothetical protein
MLWRVGAPAIPAPIGIPSRRAPAGVIAAGAALVLAFVVRELGWTGTDLAAQVYRAGLFREHGWIPWDLNWYGGHSVLSYSTLFPPVARAIGLYGAASVSAAVSTWCFARLTRHRFGDASRVGVTLFALGTVVPVAVGQLPFLLAEAFALLALVAAARRRGALAVLAAGAAGLTNAVAAIFLAFAVIALAVVDRPARQRYLAIFVAALAPTALLGLVFSAPGPFPFPAPQLIDILVVCGLGLALLPRRDRALRLGLVVYAAAAIVIFLVPNPMGGNMGRLATTVGPPLALMAAWRDRRVLLAGLAIFLIGWQWAPLTSIVARGDDPSTRADYYAPLLQHLGQQPALGRVEIPVTSGHWEAAYVARSMPLARGWERQLDTALNPIFYDDQLLTPASYQQWLHDNAVAWVAIPDAGLDAAAEKEAALIRGGLPYLRATWANAHWQVWEVVGAPGLVSGPATLLAMGPDRVQLQSLPGEVTLRVRYTPRWTVTGNACIGPTPDGWTRLVVRSPTTLTIGMTLLPTRSERC